MIVSKKEFEQMPVKLGGDLWNQYKLCRLAFTKHPNAKSIEYNLGTGLWVNISITNQDGSITKDKIFDN